MANLIVIDLRQPRREAPRQFPFQALPGWLPLSRTPMPAPVEEAPEVRRPFPWAAITAVATPWFPMARAPMPAPEPFVPVMGQDEQLRRPYPVLPGFAPPTIQLVVFDPEASKRTRQHEQVVAQILNSLMLQGKLVQTSPGVWKIVP